MPDTSTATQTTETTTATPPAQGSAASSSATTQTQTTTATTTTVRKPKPTKPAPSKRNVIEIPAQAFKERVRRDAMSMVQKETGLPWDKVVELVKQGGIQQAGGGKSAAQNTANAALETMRRENEKLRKQNERLVREQQDKDKRHKKELRRAQDRVIESELKAAAREAGINDPEYAVHLFAKAVVANPATKPEEFFASLKQSRPVLFDAPATAAATTQTTTVAASTAPAESNSQGETRPAPKPAGAPPAEINAEEMSQADFAAHQRKYGFTPGS